MKILYRYIAVVLAIFAILSFTGIVHIVMAAQTGMLAKGPKIPPIVVPTIVPTQIPTDVPTQSPTDVPTQSPTDVPTQSPTVAPTVTDTPVPTVTDTPVPTVTDTPVPTVTDTPVPTVTDTPVPTVTDTPVPTVTDTPVPTVTDTPVPTVTDTPVPNGTASPSPTVTNTPAPNGTASPSPTVTNTPAPNGTASPSPTATDTPAPNGTASPSPTATPNNATIPSGGGSAEESYVGSYEGDTLMSTSNVDPFSNVLKYETREINLLRNVSVKYEFATPEFSIYQVFVNNKDQELLTPMRIEHLKDTSIYTKKDVPGLVYANENVWIGTQRMNYISVKFRVDNSWIDKNVTNDKIVALLRWNGTVWLSYGVTMTGTDTSYTYFESRNMIMPTLRDAKASLSIFSVSALPKKANEEINTNVTNAANVTNVTDDITHVQGEVVFSDKNEMGINDPKKLPGLDIVTVMISIILSIVIKRNIGKNL